jgi:hypothetical protein
VGASEKALYQKTGKPLPYQPGGLQKTSRFVSLIAALRVLYTIQTVFCCVPFYFKKAFKLLREGKTLFRTDNGFCFPVWQTFHTGKFARRHTTHNQSVTAL